MAVWLSLALTLERRFLALLALPRRGMHGLSGEEIEPGYGVMEL